MRRLALAASLGLGIWLVGCDGSGGVADIPTGDTARALTGPAHLLITEVSLSNNNREFIEIFNPGDTAVDLSDYYLSDDADYALLPGVFGAGPVPYINVTYSFDFIVKFPDGATIAPDQVIVVAMREDGFTSAFGQAPDYAILQADPGIAMIDPGTLPGAAPGLTLAGTSAQLTNSGEGVVLFHWDGASDLVSDIDMVAVADAPSPVNTLANKTAIAVDGPDADSDTSTYQADAYTFTAMTGAAALGSSHKRVALEPGHEQQGAGGNGLFGDDETSENFAITWDSSPFSAPTPGLIPTSLLDGSYCGDGVIDPAAGEECDDGNTDNGDGCTAACQLAGCDDGLQNADEIDIDCGGHCGPGSCQAGQVCTGAGDCGSGDCDAASGTCVIASTVGTGR
ncbi:MAG: lamin tail domain-containing protein, partial [Myxococcota bacterium]